MKLPRYDAEWSRDFERERALLVAELGPLALRIEHVGSTSVPGLQAKPVIDVQISVARIDLELFREKLKRVGYRHQPMDDPPADVYPFFHKPSRWPTTHHVHLCIAGGEQEKLHIAFRDWLRAHPADRIRYGELKDLLALDVDEANIETLYAYTERKGALIQQITEKALRAGMG